MNKLALLFGLGTVLFVICAASAGLVTPAVSTTSTANLPRCGAVTLESNSYNTIISRECYSQGGSLPIFAASGFPGYVSYTFGKVNGVPTIRGGGAGSVTGSGCNLILVGNVTTSPGNYLLTMHTGKGGGSCGPARVEIGGIHIIP